MTQVREVPLSKLRLDHPFWINPRSFTGLDVKSLKEFGAEIKERGILDPLTVQRVKLNNEIVELVIDGQRRVRAALEVMPSTAKIPVVDRSDKVLTLDWEKSDELMLEVLAMGQKREGLSSFELSDVAERMRQRNKRTIAQIAEAVGRSESWVSKMLKARSLASPKLMISWRKGEITDEQFKELAEVKDHDKQAEAADEVVKARTSGDKGEARLRAKEVKEEVKAKAKKKVDDTPAVNGHSHKKPTTPANGGEQVEMWSPPPPVAQKKTMTPRHALEEMIALADKRAPTSDYVKGLMDGVRYALGELDPGDFAKAWRAYLARVSGTAKIKKSKRVTWDSKAGKPRRAKKASKARRKKARK